MITFGIIVAVLIICTLLYLLYVERKRKTLEKRNMSFLESINLTGLPIVSFVNNNQVVNLVLDTGSNTNIIDCEALKSLEHKISDVKNSIIGIAGQTNESKYILIPLEYKHKVYDVVCMSADISQTLMALKEEYGVTVHGLLGTGFFTKYKYILDFNEMIAYSKSKN